MKFNDAISGLFLAVLALAVIGYSRTFPPMPGQFVGPGVFPTVIGVGMLAGAVLLIAKGWVARATQPWATAASWVKSPRHLAHFLLILAAILGYVLVSESLGFLIVSLAMMAALFAVAGVRPWVALACAVASAFTVYFAFEKMLRVPLPRGIAELLPF